MFVALIVAAVMLVTYIFKEWKEIINEQFIDAIKTHLIDCEGVVE